MNGIHLLAAPNALALCFLSKTSSPEVDADAFDRLAARADPRSSLCDRKSTRLAQSAQAGNKGAQNVSPIA